jgi:hypothetical protein
MYKEVLSSIEHISIYPVFSFLVFFIFFLIILIWMLRTRKEDFDTISRIPLTSYDNPTSR